jgi:transposase
MMTKPLSNDLRERIVAAVDGGMSRRAAARRFGVSESAAIKLLARWQEKGSIAPRALGGDRRSGPLEAHAEELLELVEETPDLTLAELVEHVAEAHGLRVSQSAVWRLFDRHGISFKKNRARQRARAA